jgi:ATP-dependent helicase/nuclease subunit B
MRADLISLLESGATVLTPNRRLALHLRREFDSSQLAAGRSAWSTPDILPWTAWLERSYEDVLHSESGGALPMLLSAAQELALWEEAIRGSDLAATLLSPAPAAAQCRDAWKLLHAWRLQVRLRNTEANEDGKAFIEWAGRYERGCARGPYTDAARLADVIAPLIGKASIAKSTTVVVYGFDIITPQQRECMAALAGAGTSVREDHPQRREGRASRIGFMSAREEIQACARWARIRLEQNPAARIGIVVPELAQCREMVRRAFFAQMQPNHALPGTAKREPPFNVSLGIALNAHPLVHDALLLLELAGRETDFANASRLVRSPYLGGADVEMTTRARLDAVLRRRASPRVTLDGLLRLMAVKNAPRATVLTQRFAQLAEFRRSDLFGPKLPSDWAKTISLALSIGGFPGDRSLDSMEYQTLKKWHEVVAGFATLDRVAGRIGYAQACARLSRMAADTLFQPEAEDVPIQILGTLESNHLHFDHLWVTGLTEDIWPIPLRPNPFVPVGLQRETGIPDANPATALELDRRITQGWLGAAAEIVLSYPQREEDRELLPSPLIESIAESASAELGIPAHIGLRDMINLAAHVETVSDFNAPPLTTATAHQGGTTVFKDQAACPFRAFARHRLGAESLDAPLPGLDAMDRGTLLHAVLAAVWKSLRNKARLDSIAEEDLEKLLDACASEAIAKVRQWRVEALSGRFAELEKARLVVLARSWLLFEKQRADFEVVLIEQKRPMTFGGVTVNVTLDRMDELASGGRAILDYKTGTASVSAWLGPRPDEPQVPLYALGSGEDVAAAAFAVIKAGHAEFKGVARENDLLPGVKTISEQRSVMAAHYDSWETLFAGWRIELDELGSGFASGDARVDPKRGDETCKFCDLHALCRINERSAELYLKEEKGAEDE